MGSPDWDRLSPLHGAEVSVREVMKAQEERFF